MAGSTSIMTQTLPTVVGMGVVSKTTETMFDKRRRGKIPKRRTIKIHQGPRGGRYIMRKGRKIYL